MKDYKLTIFYSKHRIIKNKAFFFLNWMENGDSCCWDAEKAQFITDKSEKWM